MPGNQIVLKRFILSFCVAMLVMGLTACTNNIHSYQAKQGTLSESTWTPAAAGSIIAIDSMVIKDDPLNKSHFAVKIRVPLSPSSSNSSLAVYEVLAHYGVEEANGSISMPKGGEHLMPLLRKADEHSFIIGFIPGNEYGGDTSFHEYYKVEGRKGMITIKALNGFQIQN